MMRTIKILLLLLITGCFTAVAQGQKCCLTKYTRQQLDSISLPDLGREFKRLKSLKCKDCDLMSGDLYDVMQVLGDRLKGKCKKEVLKVMGKPDEKEKESLVYHWRGQGHDYLFFDCENPSKVESGWYHAYE